MDVCPLWLCFCMTSWCISPVHGLWLCDHLDCQVWPSSFHKYHKQMVSNGYGLNWRVPQAVFYHHTFYYTDHKRTSSLHELWKYVFCDLGILWTSCHNKNTYSLSYYFWFQHVSYVFASWTVTWRFCHNGHKHEYSHNGQLCNGLLNLQKIWIHLACFCSFSKHSPWKLVLSSMSP